MAGCQPLGFDVLQHNLNFGNISIKAIVNVRRLDKVGMVGQALGRLLAEWKRLATVLRMHTTKPQQTEFALGGLGCSLGHQIITGVGYERADEKEMINKYQFPQ